MALAMESGGKGEPVLVLLHGLGATRQVWRPFTAGAAARWPGRWVAVDLPGHGASPCAADYGPHAQAATVAAALRALPAARPLAVLGHSMGGLVALALASGQHGVQPAHALALGVKVAWSPEELAGLALRATAPARLFATRDEAISLYLKVSGLLGLVAPDSDMALAGVRAAAGGWRLAMDPAAHGVGAPDMAGLIRDARAPLSVARGDHDAMTSAADLRRWTPHARELSDAGHNVMVEKPALVWSWLTSELLRPDAIVAWAERARHV
jgi:pimeloyl-ACP methyl ester carboxylesterase